MIARRYFGYNAAELTVDQCLAGDARTQESIAVKHGSRRLIAGRLYGKYDRTHFSDGWG